MEGSTEGTVSLTIFKTPVFFFGIPGTDTFTSSFLSSISFLRA